MADANPTKPRPRPRPRLISKKSAPTPQNASDATPQDPTQRTASSAPPNATTQDTDDIGRFIINRGRTKDEWKILKEEAEKKLDDGGSDNDEYMLDDWSNQNSSPRKRAKVEDPRPRWETDDVYADMLKKRPQTKGATGSDAELYDDEGSDSATNNERQKGKRKRSPSRSRSRSLSPAPRLTAQQLQAIRERVRQTGPHAGRRASSPSFEMPEQTEPMDLAPELQNILAKATTQAPESTQHTSMMDEKIKITVRWQPHPLDPDGESDPRAYDLLRSQPLKILFEAIAEEFETFEDTLRLTYNGRRIFPSVTPFAIKMFGNEEDVVACEETTFEYIREHPTSVQTGDFDFAFTQSQSRANTHIPSSPPRRQATPPVASSSRIPQPRIFELSDSSPEPEPVPFAAASTSYQANDQQDSDSGDESEIDIVPQTQTQTQTQTQIPTQTQTQSQAQPRYTGKSNDDEDTFKLVVRSARTTKDISLTVRPTTKCGAIVKAFIKKAGLEAEFPELFVDPAAAAPPAPVPEPEPEPEPPARGRGGKRGRGGRGRGRGRGRGKGKAAAAAVARDPTPPPPVPAHSGKDPRICIDGDKMDNNTPISEAELDDGDMIDIVGL